MSSSYLGYLCWYTLTTGPQGAETLDVTPEQLTQWFKELGLDSSFLPKQMRSVDAFRGATSPTRTSEYVSEDGVRYRLSVVEHGSTQDLIKRYVMRRPVDRRLEVPELADEDEEPDGPVHPGKRVANITFYRPRRSMHGRVSGSEDVRYRLHAGIDGVDREQVQAFVDNCLTEYEAMRHSLTPARMRALLRDYLTFKNAVPILHGLWFAPLRVEDSIRALQALTARMGQACRMILVPLVDDPEQREMLRQAIDDNVEESARSLLDKIAAWDKRNPNPNKAPTPGVIDSWREEYRGLQNLVSSYSDELDLAFPAAADALEDLQAAINRLAGRFAHHQMWR